MSGTMVLSRSGDAASLASDRQSGAHPGVSRNAIGQNRFQGRVDETNRNSDYRSFGRVRDTLTFLCRLNGIIAPIRWVESCVRYHLPDRVGMPFEGSTGLEEESTVGVIP